MTLCVSAPHADDERVRTFFSIEQSWRGRLDRRSCFARASQETQYTRQQLWRIMGLAF